MISEQFSMNNEKELAEVQMKMADKLKEIQR